VAVSRLRKVLEPDRSSRGDARLVVTRAPGYTLNVDPEEIDLGRFERLVSDAQRAQPSAAAALLREALALWRGPPLADLAYESFAQAEIARLDEARLSALEQRIEADLALGRHLDVVGELERLVAEHPLRERLRAQLMLALYRSGRQAESLESYRAGRELLVEGLGIEPGRELRDLHEAGDALVKAGSMDEAKLTFLDACDLARTERMAESFARAARGYSGSPGWARAGGDGRVVPLLEEALSALGRERSPLRARLLARLAGALRDEPSLEPRARRSRLRASWMRPTPSSTR
jgi:DNA-binding SARP family transcriptional activator